MFNLNALVFLTVFNLIALVQIASNLLSPARLQNGLVVGAAVICVATSFTGLAMAMLIPSTVVGIACVTIAALVNLLAVLGTGLDRLADPRSAEAMRHLRGLARLAIIGAPYTPGGQPSSRQRGNSRPTGPTTPRGVRATAQAPARPTTNGAPSQQTSQSSRPVPGARRANSGALPLTPRQTHTVPRRPNRLPTDSLAFLLTVEPENAPDIFADSRASMEQLPALARRVRLVSTDPRHPSIPPQSVNVWPSAFSQPDPAWSTSYGRIPALAHSM